MTADKYENDLARLGYFENVFTDSQKAMIKVCDELADMLVKKNKSYGNSAFLDTKFNGRTITAREGIEARIMDKIKRLTGGSEYGSDDTIVDLAGYLIIYLAEQKLRNKEI